MAEKIRLATREHPLYLDNLGLWEMYLDAAMGGENFINDDYILTHRLEDDDDYKERVERGYYLNFCDAIPSIYNSYIFKAGVERPPDKVLEKFRSNVDGRGTEISDYVKKLGFYSSIFGVIHALVDMPYLNKDIVSKRDSEEYGLYPYCSIVYPMQLVDWSLDRYGNFRWVVIKSTYYRDIDPDVERIQEDHYKLITRDEWRVEDEDGIIVTFDDGAPNRGKNELGIVPIVTMYHKDINDDKVGESMIKDIVYVNKTILNWTSCIDEQIERQTFSQLVVPDDGSLAEASETEDDPLKKLGTAHAYTFPADATHPPSFISPDTSTISVIWDLVVDHIKEMYRMGGLQGGTSDLYTSRSGRQSQMSFMGVNSSIAEKSIRYEKFENAISRLAYLQLNEDVSKYESVKYPSEFDVVALNEEIDALFKIMERNFSGVLNKTMMKNVARRVTPLAPQSIRKEIEDEINSGDGRVESIKATENIEAEKNGDGNTNTDLGDSYKTKSDRDKKEKGHRQVNKK